MLTYAMLARDCKSSLCSPLGVATCRGAMFNQCILSCVLMALVYIHYAIMWIQMWKQCVVFLQQIVTSKLQTIHCLDAHLQLRLTTIIQKPKIVMTCQTAVSLCTCSILMCLPTSPYNSHKHLHICTQPKSKLLDLSTQQTVLGSSTSQETSCITLFT